MIAIHRKPFALNPRHAFDAMAKFQKLTKYQDRLSLRAKRKSDDEGDEEGEMDTEYDIWGDRIEEMELDGETAHIPVKGILAKGLPSIARCFGFTDVDDFMEDVEEAAANEMVKNICLDIDSPGGYVSGLIEAYDVLTEVGKTKRIMAFSEGQCASGAYWLACPAEAVYCTKTAEVGSIGAYTIYMDDSQFWASMGVKLELFTSGIYKGMGEVALTDDQRKLIQSEIDTLAGQFKAMVKMFRSEIPDDAMEGQTFMGEAAAEKGFVTGIAKNYENAVANFLESA
jgi:signal peptide peptidase SppA